MGEGDLNTWSKWNPFFVQDCSTRWLFGSFLHRYKITLRDWPSSNVGVGSLLLFDEQGFETEENDLEQWWNPLRCMEHALIQYPRAGLCYYRAYFTDSVGHHLNSLLESLLKSLTTKSFAGERRWTFSWWFRLPLSYRSSEIETRTVFRHSLKPDSQRRQSSRVEYDIRSVPLFRIFCCFPVHQLLFFKNTWCSLGDTKRVGS